MQSRDYMESVQKVRNESLQSSSLLRLRCEGACCHVVGLRRTTISHVVDFGFHVSLTSACLSTHQL